MTNLSEEPVTGPVLDGRAPRPAAGTGPVSPGVGPGQLRTSRFIAWLTDDLVKVPGTQFGVGMDVLIGLIPGVGDALGSGFTGAIMVDAVKQRVPYRVLFRMGFNLLLDLLLGLIPAVGDFADVAHRANRKNYRLLEECVVEGHRVDASVPGYVFRASLIVIGVQVVAWTLIGVIVWGLLSGLGLLINR